MSKNVKRRKKRKKKRYPILEIGIFPGVDPDGRDFVPDPAEQ